MSFRELVRARRSIRKYSDRTVAREHLEMIVKAGQYAPSGGNNQSSHFLVFTNRDKICELNSIIRTEFSKMKPYEGMYKSMVNTVNNSRREDYDFSYGAPVLILVANKIGYSNAMADSVLCLENMLLQATDLGISSCYVNQVNWLRDDPAVLEYLYSCGLKEDERVYCSAVFGHSEMTSLPQLPRHGNEATFIE